MGSPTLGTCRWLCCPPRTRQSREMCPISPQVWHVLSTWVVAACRRRFAAGSLLRSRSRSCAVLTAAVTASGPRAFESSIKAAVFCALVASFRAWSISPQLAACSAVSTGSGMARFLADFAPRPDCQSRNLIHTLECHVCVPAIGGSLLLLSLLAACSRGGGRHDARAGHVPPALPRSWLQLPAEGGRDQ